MKPDGSLEEPTARLTGRRRAGPRGFAAACLAVLLAAAPAAAPRMVTFPGPDGRTLAGLLSEADARPAPAVVLVPMLGGSKEDWREVAQRLADGGITALAIDLPQGALARDAPPPVAWHLDLRAALEYLAGRPDVQPGALGIAGASLGASLAALAAAADTRARSLALVSPALDYRGVRLEAAMRQYGGRPALLMASLRDAYAARTVRDLAKGTGLRETRWSDAPGHGTVLLAREPDLVRVLVEWFQRTLR